MRIKERPLWQFPGFTYLLVCTCVLCEWARLDLKSSVNCSNVTQQRISVFWVSAIFETYFSAQFTKPYIPSGYFSSSFYSLDVYIRSPPPHPNWDLFVKKKKKSKKNFWNGSENRLDIVSSIYESQNKSMGKNGVGIKWNNIRCGLIPLAYGCRFDRRDWVLESVVVDGWLLDWPWLCWRKLHRTKLRRHLPPICLTGCRS